MEEVNIDEEEDYLPDHQNLEDSPARLSDSPDEAGDGGSSDTDCTLSPNLLCPHATGGQCFNELLSYVNVIHIIKKTDDFIQVQ